MAQILRFLQDTHTSVSQTANFSLRSVPSIDARAGHDLCLFEPVTVANPTEAKPLHCVGHATTGVHEPDMLWHPIAPQKTLVENPSK
jgi:hypothetical protein